MFFESSFTHNSFVYSISQSFMVDIDISDTTWLVVLDGLGHFLAILAEDFSREYFQPPCSKWMYSWASSPFGEFKKRTSYWRSWWSGWAFRLSDGMITSDGMVELSMGSDGPRTQDGLVIFSDHGHWVTGWFGAMDFYDFPWKVGNGTSQLTKSIIFQRGRKQDEALEPECSHVC